MQVLEIPGYQGPSLEPPPITGKIPLFNVLAENMAHGRCFQAVLLCSPLFTDL